MSERTHGPGEHAFVPRRTTNGQAFSHKLAWTFKLVGTWDGSDRNAGWTCFQPFLSHRRSTQLCSGDSLVELVPEGARDYRIETKARVLNGSTLWTATSSTSGPTESSWQIGTRRRRCFGASVRSRNTHNEGPRDLVVPSLPVGIP